MGTFAFAACYARNRTGQPDTVKTMNNPELLRTSEVAELTQAMPDQVLVVADDLGIQPVVIDRTQYWNTEDVEQIRRVIAAATANGDLEQRLRRLH